MTADDYVATFRYAADPKHAWDFTWFFGGVIKNWDDVVAGKMPVDQLGRQGRRRALLQFETQAPAPYLPAMLLVQHAAAEEGARNARAGCTIPTRPPRSRPAHSC